MNFDTGSADLWAFNTQLPGTSTDGHSVYDPTKSKTSSPLPGFSWEIQYHDGTSASGNVVTDTVTTGGIGVANQAVELPTSISDQLVADHNVDGIVGVGFSNINKVTPQQQKTFFENVAPSLKQPVMTAFLNSTGVGSYEFGVIDSNKYTGDLISVPVDSSNGYWQFESPSFSVGGKPLQAIKTTTSSVADTGTSLLLVSPDVAKAFYSEVPGAKISDGGYVYPCNTSLPTLALGVGDQYSVVLEPEALTYAVDSVAQDGTLICSGGVQSCENGQFQVFGDVFLKSVFTVFDLGGPSLQFGHLAVTPTPPAFVNSNS
jgi:aspergillopepsin I